MFVKMRYRLDCDHGMTNNQHRTQSKYRKKLTPVQTSVLRLEYVYVHTAVCALPGSK